LYPRVCGMTATALTQADEFKQVYDLDVVAIPTNRPSIRVDHPDVVFTHQRAKEMALIDEIREVHTTGRPILVGTASVAESERLGHALSLEHIKHEILNARNDEAEARIIAQAGALGAVTISTNMAGRGTDILLGGDPPRDRETIVALGGLYVVGTNKHESRRIDNQLRGRAGRQGDPGSSRFFVSLEDDLIQRFGIYDLLPPHYRRLRSPEPLKDPLLAREIDRVQTIIESQNLEIRRTLWKYEGILEKQRRIVHQRRRDALLGDAPSLVAERDPERWAEIEERFGTELASRVERRIAIAKIDELWSEYLASVTEIREGVRWSSFSGFDPLIKFQAAAVELFDVFLERLERETVEAFANADITENGIDAVKEGLLDTSSTWTYLINDQPFGDFTERMHRNVKRMFRAALGVAGQTLAGIVSI
jgi:preprotein translocase subunit SecA